MDLCGHATLASAHFLWEAGHLGRSETARFQSKSGPLTACYRDGLIELDFPSEPVEPVAPPPELLRALGVGHDFVGKNRLDYLVKLDSEAAVRRLTPDFALLGRLETRGVIVTAGSEGGEYDFVSRYFAPVFGIDEDPVTGSAHCCLGPYWGNLLGREEMVGYQASQRGGTVRVPLAGKRVRLGGQAVTVFRGELVEG